MSIKYRKLILFLIMAMVLTLSLSGCASKYKTKPNYDITEQVTMSFMNAYMQGDIDKAMENVAEEAILSTDSGQMKGKATIAEMLKINIEKENKMEIAEKAKIDDSKTSLTINNKIPLFQLAGVDVVKTRETFEVQDSKIVKWEIKHLKESVDLIESVATSTIGIETEVKDGKIVVTRVIEKTPAAAEEIKKGDIIETIDGIALKDMKHGAEEIPYRLIGEVGTRVELKMTRGTESTTVKLTRVNINDIK